MIFERGEGGIGDERERERGTESESLLIVSYSWARFTWGESSVEA